jgi:predicted O-linked N-acetylglucosamine transferase (SPINDLY family)
VGEAKMQEELHHLNQVCAAGRHSEAEQLCRHILRRRSSEEDVIDLLSAALRDAVDGDALVLLAQEAVARDPSNPSYHHFYGTVLGRQGRFDDAILAYREALRLKPEYLEARYLHAVALHARGSLQEALGAYDDVLRSKPDLAQGHYQRAKALEELKRPGEALAGYERALRITSGFAEAHEARARLLMRDGRPAEALAAYEEAIRLNPELILAHSGRAEILLRQGRYEDAVAAYDEVLRIRPELVQVQVNRGIAFEKLGRYREALASYDEVMRAQPTLPELHLNRGVTLEALGRFKEALASYEEALRIAPDLVEAYVNKGKLLSNIGCVQEALSSYRTAVRLNPGLAEASSNFLMSLEYDPSQEDASVFEAHRRWGRSQEGRVERCRSHANQREPERTLRVGLVSPDLRKHPVGDMIMPVMASTDSAAVAFVCYSNLDVEDDRTEAIKERALAWRSVLGAPDDALAKQIREDGIDILIDLAGHTAGNRLPVFAMKPAPVQVTWLGYRGTTGLSAVDYVLADPITVPPACEHHFTEQVVRLTDTRLCYAPPAYAPAPGPPPMLERGSPTFGSFNNLVKLNPEVMKLWADLLTAIPEARLVLKWRAFGQPEARERYHQLIEGLGVEPNRVELRGATPHREMLAEYGDVDIALDPFPFSGGVSSLEALWQGVPVVTRPSARLVSRQTAAFVTALEHPEWVAEDGDDYIRIATALARSPERLAALRREQRDRMLASVLCDGPRFARNLERALRSMWRSWCSQTASSS